MFTLLKLARRNILRHARYSIGSGLAVAAGFLALTLFQAYIMDIRLLYEESYEHRGMYGNVLIEHTGSIAERRASPWDFVIHADQQKAVDGFLAERSKEIFATARFLLGTGLITNGTMQTIFLMKGHSVAEGARMRGAKWDWDTALGNPLSHSKEESPVVLGLGLAEILGCTIPPSAHKLSKAGNYEATYRAFECTTKEFQLSTSTASGQTNALSATMVGAVNAMYREIDERFIMAPIELVQRLYQTDAVSAYSVLLNDANKAPEFISAFNQFAADKQLPIISANWKDHREGEMYRRTMNLLAIFRNFVVTILVVITGLSVFNTFLKAVKERTREIGTLRSIGFSMRSLLAVFGMEAAMLCLIGTAAGAILSVSLTALLNHSGIMYKAGLLADPIPFHLAFALEYYVTSAAFLIGVSVFAAVFAAAGTTRAPIAENLIHV